MESNFLYQYYYLWSVALIVPLWAAIFFKMKRSRQEMIFIGIFFGAIAMFFDRYSSFHDYWRPPTMLELYNFESFLYGFFVGGICCKIYEWISRREYVAANPPHTWFLIGIMLLNNLVFAGVAIVFHYHTVLRYMIMLMASTVVLLAIRPRFYKVALGSGIVMTGLVIVWYAVILAIYPDAINDIWIPIKLSGINLFNIPIEEHGFIFAAGCSGSLTYKVAVSLGKSGAIQTLPLASDEMKPEPSPLWKKALKTLRISAVPIGLLIAVLGRMAIFGKTGINLGKVAQFFQ